jgi:hypothetical protein
VIEPSGGPITVQLAYDASVLREPGVYVGTVWAKPATDPLGGASFGLTNTVIVPHALPGSVRLSGTLTPGAAARHFFEVPAAAGGITVVLSLSDSTQDATLYLFEPDGVPHRGGSSVHTAGTGRAEMHVASEDLDPGVYEAVIVAPPTVPVSYQLHAMAAMLEVETDARSTRVSLRNAAPVGSTGRIGARAVGSRAVERVGAALSQAQVVEVTIPEAAATLALEVVLAHDLWQRLTDFGVTVFDVTGRKLSDGPLHYPVGRQSIPVETYRPGETLFVELMPAFADGAGDHRWDATVQSDFLHVDPVVLEPEGTTDGRFALEAGAVAEFAFRRPPDGEPQHETGNLVEYRIELDDGSVITAHAIAEVR